MNPLKNISYNIKQRDKYLIIVAMMIELSACDSPYSYRGMPEVMGVHAVMTGTNTGQIELSPDLPADCEFRKNAVLLTSANLALTYSFDHFEFSEGDKSRLKFLSECKKDTKPFTVYLCRGTCPTMYSADGISHVMVDKFAKSMFSAPRYGMVTSRDMAADLLSNQK